MAGELARAIESYARALEYRPDFAEALDNLGNALHQQGRDAEAEICYRRAEQVRFKNTTRE